MNTSFHPGDHLLAKRQGYEHHGIYVGNGLVIHFAADSKRIRDAVICKDTFAKFARKSPVAVVAYAHTFSADEVVRRAEESVGEASYHLIFNNCEHFSRWCKTGHHESQQVRNAAAKTVGAGSSAGLGAGALAVISAAGPVAGLSGSGIMSGLATVGGIVGSGALAGMTILAVAPAILTNVATHQALKDDPCLADEERTARKAGRWGTKAGSVGGTGGAIALVSAAGVPGLSASGITSGLAAIGGVFGGGMAMGAFIAIATPAAVGGFLGWGLYKLFRRKR